MIYEVAALVLLAQRCAPEVATEAVVPLVVAESGGNTLAINVNKGPRVRAGSVADGAELVRRYVSAGYTIDVGLAQVNSANFARLGVTIEQAFDPCTNLRMAATVLQQGFGVASRHYIGLDAISATYSLYNTGTLTRGFRNGYVARIWSTASALGSLQDVPALPASPYPMPATEIAWPKAMPDRESWVVGQIASNRVEVFK